MIFFFITLFRYFTIVLFFTLHFFSFSQGMQTRERAHCARSVFPFIKKKKDIYTFLLDRIESKAIRLIGDPSLTLTLDPLCLRCKVASLSIFYRYYFGHCSDELAACIPPPMARPRSTRQATFAHNYCVELSNARINRFSDGFFPSTYHL